MADELEDQFLTATNAIDGAQVTNLVEKDFEWTEENTKGFPQIL